MPCWLFSNGNLYNSNSHLKHFFLGIMLPHKIENFACNFLLKQFKFHTLLRWEINSLLQRKELYTDLALVLIKGVPSSHLKSLNLSKLKEQILGRRGQYHASLKIVYILQLEGGILNYWLRVFQVFNFPYSIISLRQLIPLRFQFLVEQPWNMARGLTLWVRFHQIDISPHRVLLSILILLWVIKFLMYSQAFQIALKTLEPIGVTRKWLVIK